MNEKLIVDVGMHVGTDTDYYLERGFQVAAVEANPVLAERGRERFRDAIKDHRLTIFNVAIAPYQGEIDFYLNEKFDDWGTTEATFVKRYELMGGKSRAVKVPCTTFARILEQTGVPYYLKIDIEGADVQCLKDLIPMAERPKYTSIEASVYSLEESFTALAYLWVLGYRQFKIVNQARHYPIRYADPLRKGEFVEHRFDAPSSSGPFGEETPGPWLSVEQTFLKFRRILREQRYFGANGLLYRTIVHRVYERLKREPVGWYEFHARLGEGA